MKCCEYGPRVLFYSQHGNNRLGRKSLTFSLSSLPLCSINYGRKKSFIFVPRSYIYNFIFKDVKLYKVAFPYSFWRENNQPVEIVM
jgi:hypothetical protein